MPLIALFEPSFLGMDSASSSFVVDRRPDDSDDFKPRTRHETPSHQDGGQSLPPKLSSIVRLRHPGYSDKENVLLVLPALDHPEGGIHHETARIACAIVANNSWEGYFTMTKSGERVMDGPDGILRGEDYYFWVSGKPEEMKYPVVPTFEHWTFPHHALPLSWSSSELSGLSSNTSVPRQSNLAMITMNRDVSCRITNYIEGTESAHLVPLNEQEWFDRNGMYRYTTTTNSVAPAIQDARNAILLRSDIHTTFDQKRFTVVPKASVPLVHVTAQGLSDQFIHLHHNVPMQPLEGVAIEFFLARFAWTIFGNLINFVTQGVLRRFRILDENGSADVKDYAGTACKDEFLYQGKARSKSPRKRQRDASAALKDDAENVEELTRGRKRRRSFDTLLWEEFSETRPWSTLPELISPESTSPESSVTNFTVATFEHAPPDRPAYTWNDNNGGWSVTSNAAKRRLEPKDGTTLVEQ